MTRWTRPAAAVVAGALMTGTFAAGSLPAWAAPGARVPAAAAPMPNSGFDIKPTPRPGSIESAGYFNMITFPTRKYTESVSVANYTKAPMTLRLYPADAYTIRKGGGFAVQGLGKAPQDVGAWVSGLPKVVTVPAGKQLNIGFAVRVPANATPGIHAGGIVAQATVPEVVQVNSQLRSKVYRQVFARVYATVPGPLIPDFQIDSMQVTHPQPPIPLVTRRDGKVSYVLSNTGNAIVSPTAQVRATGWFGVSLDRTVPANSQLLPGGIAGYDVDWPHVPALGPVHVKLTVRSAYGLTRTEEYSYWALPVPFLIVSSVLLAALVAGAVLLVRRRRRKAGTDETESEAEENKAALVPGWPGGA